MIRLHKLFTVAVLALCPALIIALLSVNVSYAKETFVPLPEVTGSIINKAGEPIEYALVVVTILGSHQKADTAFGDIFKLAVIHDMTDKEGKFTITSENINLVDASGKKAFLVGCRVEISQKDYSPLRLDIANPSDSNSGVISIFLNSALQHHGSFFGAITAGFNGVKAHAFVPQYVKSMTTESLTMTTAADELEISQADSNRFVDDGSYSAALYNKLYEANKRNSEAKSPTAEKINRFNMLYQD